DEKYGQESSIRPEGADEPTFDWADVATTYRAEWQAHYPTSGARWEDFEPAFRYGHEMAQAPRFRGREWSEMEPELRQNYATWTEQHGYHFDDTDWDRMREHTHEAMDRSRLRRAA